jgi:hypothetical protein
MCSYSGRVQNITSVATADSEGLYSITISASIAGFGVVKSVQKVDLSGKAPVAK